MIVVTYDSQVLGAGEFWRGKVSQLTDLHRLQVVAHGLAVKVSQDGVTRTRGMWTVSQQPDSEGGA